jgi:predicted dehydrogenase
VKALFAGLGSIGQRHARNLRTLLGEDVELLAYRVRRSSPVINTDLTADPDGDVEAALGIRAFDDLEAALAERPETVFVTNPNSLHLDVAVPAARAGCHLFVEKPLADRLDGVDELARLVEEQGLVCLVAYQLRFHPAFRRLQALVGSGELGTILAARVQFGEYLPGWHPYEDYRLMHAARRDQGGGVLLAQIHDLDLAYALFGLPRRVFALGGRRSSLEVDVEDVASVLLDCDPVAVHVQQDLVQRPPSRTYEVLGEQGTAVWDYHGGDLRVTTPGGEQRESFRGLDRNELFLDELRHFLACVEGRERPLVGLSEGADSLRVALAARRSLETGTIVELDGAG